LTALVRGQNIEKLRNRNMQIDDFESVEETFRNI